MLTRTCKCVNFWHNADELTILPENMEGTATSKMKINQKLEGQRLR